MKMKKALKNVKANPFRHIDRYPIREEKVEALKKSINDTDFWENIVARDMGDGTIEIAYGHHRLHTLRELFGERKQFDFIIKKLSDTEMCKIMAHENMEEWGSDAYIEQETVRAVVEGYADGRVELPPVPAKTGKSKIRYAPSFQQGSSSESDDHPYTTSQLSDFLGWKEWKVKAALASLEKIEGGAVAEDVFKGITTEQQAKINTEMNKAQRQAELDAKRAEKDGDAKAAKEHRRRGKTKVKQVARELHKEFKKGAGTRDAAVIAKRVTEPSKGPKDFPDLIPVTQRLAVKLSGLLDADTTLGEQVRAVLKYKSRFDEKTRASLHMSLRELADAANELADKVK